MTDTIFKKRNLFFILLLLIPLWGFANSLTEGPSVNLVTPNSVTIVWKTEEPSLGSVDLTNEQGKSITIFKEKSKKATIDHQITLSNLKPETVYGYHVLATSPKSRFKSEWFPFSTAIKKDTPFRFASMADSRGSQNGVNVKVLSAIVTKVKEEKPELIIFQGDLIGGVCDATVGRVQFRQWKQVMQPLWESIPVYPGVGNHDASVHINKKPVGKEIFTEEFVLPENGPKSYQESVYSFDYGNSHFVTLNSNDYGNEGKDNHRINIEQLDWLVQDLASTKQLHKFAGLHEPPYPSGSHIGSSMDKYPEDRDKFLEVCNKYGVEIIFCGHEHNYDRWNLDSTLNPVLHSTIYQVKNGTCGAPIYKTNKDTRNQMAFKDAYNYVLVDVAGPKVTVTAYDIDGNQIDQFSYQKP